MAENVTNKWGSVRKVRFKSQIISFIEFLLQKNDEHFSLAEVTELIKSDRAKRQYKRLKILQEGGTRALRSIGILDSKSYKWMARDTISFAKGIGIVIQENDRYTKGDLLTSWTLKVLKNNIETKNRLIKLLLESRYHAYQSFLLHLQSVGKAFEIPMKYKARTKKSGFPSFLKNSGFFTDAASFHTMRDLFYDLGLLNWVISSETHNELLYSSSKLVPKSSSEYEEEFIFSIELKEYNLLHTRRISDFDFLNVLKQEYLSLTNKRWARIVEYIQLRDRVCSKLRISDEQYNNLIIKQAKNPIDYKITLSQGVMTRKPLTGALVKALSIPEIEKDVYGTFVRIRRRNER